MTSYEIRKIDSSFFLKYNPSIYIELENKIDRPYDVVLFETAYDYFICIPFRSSIQHNNAYHFKNSTRSSISKSGLDYSKIIIIDNPAYIGSPAIVDKDEANELYQNSNKIHIKAQSYVENYRNHILNVTPFHPKEFDRRYRFTTLKYFHSELKLPE